MWGAPAIVYLSVILLHHLFLDFPLPKEDECSCRYLKSAQQQDCGLLFVDNLLYCKHTNNPNFRKGENFQCFFSNTSGAGLSKTRLDEFLWCNCNIYLLRGVLYTMKIRINFGSTGECG